MPSHPEMEAEQAYIDRCYDALDRMRAEAKRLGDAVRTLGKGGTHAARVERDVFVRASAERLASLDIGHEPLVFGRIDTDDDERFYIGRVAVSGEDREPLVVDWRAPAAEPFYRATGRAPLGLTLRRHFLCDGQKLLGISDERFAADAGELGLVGTEALMAALGRERTGRMRDIVATVQREQDQIIREDLPGVLVVQGGPGTGKTAVALHRAAYLLFTHRHALERDGVLVVGPNQLFLKYISQVLPALGESGVALTTSAGLVPDVRVTGVEAHETERLKGDERMAKVIANAVRDRERPLRRDLVLTVNDRKVRLTVKEAARIVSQVRRRRQPHNDLRRHVVRLALRALHRSYERTFKGTDVCDLTEEEFASEVRSELAVRRALERMWPRLAPWELVHDLLGSRALIESASKGVLKKAEWELLHRRWVDDPMSAPWTKADLALIDEATELLGPLRRRGLPSDEIPDYGHIVVDEAQDLSPMELRMLTRRSRTGSMTITGDIAQATGHHAPRSWDAVLAHLPDRGPRRIAGLTVNYRTPAEVMTLAERVLAAAPVDVDPPSSVRSTDEVPRVVRVRRAELGSIAADAVTGTEGIAAVITSPSLLDEVADALTDAGVPFGRGSAGLDRPVALLDVSEAKGLEWDSVVVVEPEAIVAEAPHGLHALYVALTRPTQRLTVLHARELPEPLA